METHGKGEATRSLPKPSALVNHGPVRTPSMMEGHQAVYLVALYIRHNWICGGSSGRSIPPSMSTIQLSGRFYDRYHPTD